jgi:LysR family nitrogen assimilation transcriptional regulator
MNLRYARTFVAVAELGTVSKAAERLRIAQPALSRQIGALEQELGLKLFDRVGSRLALTGEGEQLLGDCRVLLNYARALGERAQLLRRGDRGILKVASSPQYIEGVICEFLHRYAERYPNVQVKLIEAIGPDTLEMLERGEIHLGQNLLRAVQPGNTRLASHPLKPVDLLAVWRPPLVTGKGAAIEIARLAAYPLLLLDTSFIFRRTFDAACRLAGIEVNIAFESRVPHTLLEMAEKGHGVAIVPSALRIDRYPLLRIARVTYQGKALREPLAIFWDKRRPLPAYASAFCEMLADYAGEVFPISRPSEPKRGATMRRGTRRPAKVTP